MVEVLRLASLVLVGIALILLIPANVEPGAIGMNFGTACMFTAGLAFLALWSLFLEKRDVDPLQYKKLKRRVVKGLQNAKAEGRLTQAVISQSRSVFYMKAESLGIDRRKIEEDFEKEIRKKVEEYEVPTDG